MLALQITALKPFMNSLLLGELFDSFLLEKADIDTYVTYSIDGRLHKDFFPLEERGDKPLHPYDFVEWKDMKGLCFDFIKGKRTPLRFQFVFHLKPAAIASILEKGGAASSANLIQAFVLTVRFDGEKALLLTGTSFTSFVPDKEPERLWDAAFRQYLDKKGIAYEEM